MLERGFGIGGILLADDRRITLDAWRKCWMELILRIKCMESFLLILIKFSKEKET